MVRARTAAGLASITLQDLSGRFLLSNREADEAARRRGGGGSLVGRLPQGPVQPRSPEDSSASLLHEDVLQDTLGMLPCPVWVEADVGHVAPQWPWRQGGLASCQWDGEALTLVQEPG